jgi:hypothetical protein
MLNGMTTRDVLAIAVVGGALVFNGISLVNGLQPDAATMTLAGAVVGYYFKPGNGEQPIMVAPEREAPLPPPDIPGEDE